MIERLGDLHFLLRLQPLEHLETKLLSSSQPGPSSKVYLLSCHPVPLGDSLLVLGLLPVPPVVDLAERGLVDVQRVAVPQLGPGPQSNSSDLTSAQR